MVNPGAFKGARLAFLLGQRDLYANAVLKGHSAECIVDIQCRFFKRFPLDLADEIEPSAEWLKSVNDNAADPEPDSPNKDTMSPEEFALATAAFKKRSEVLEFKRHQIKCWMIYQYRKKCIPCVANHPLSTLIPRLTGDTLSSAKPRRAVAYTVWGKLHASQVDDAFSKRQKALKVPKDQFLRVRAAVTKELFDGLPSATQKEWADRVEMDYKEAIAQWELKQDEEVSKDPADRQKCIEGIVGFAQPILDLIGEYTGMKCTLLVGGPEPAGRGRLNVVGVHSGKTQGAIKSTFGEIERAAYKELIIPLYSRFLKKCYTKEECRAAALANPGPSLSELMASAREEFGSATIHRGELGFAASPPFSAPPSPPAAGLAALSPPPPGPGPLPRTALPPRTPSPSFPLGPSPPGTPILSPAGSPHTPSPPLPGPALPASPPTLSPPPSPGPLPPASTGASLSVSSSPLRLSSATGAALAVTRVPSPIMALEVESQAEVHPPSWGGRGKRALANEDEAAPSKQTKTPNSLSPARSAPISALPPSAPAWLVSASGMLHSEELGAEWTALVGLWETFEDAQHQEKHPKPYESP